MTSNDTGKGTAKRNTTARAKTNTTATAKTNAGILHFVQDDDLKRATTTTTAEAMWGSFAALSMTRARGAFADNAVLQECRQVRIIHSAGLRDRGTVLIGVHADYRDNHVRFVCSKNSSV